MTAPTELEVLVRDPREQMHVEVKGWLDLATNEHKALLAKAIMALANHGGGFIVIGFARTDGVYREAQNRPAGLGAWNDDAINGLVRSYVAPSFHCNVHLVTHPETQSTYPLIAVPGGHRVPIQAVRGSPDQRSLINGRIYIRRPGPESAEPGTPDEWRDIFARCLRANRDDLLDALRDVLVGPLNIAPPVAPLEPLLEFADDATERWKQRLQRDAQGRPRLPAGNYRLAYAIQDEFARPTLPELRRHMQIAERPNTGAPEWAEIDRPTAIDGGLEAFHSRIHQGIEVPASAEFWRATPEGRLALIRGYQEDAHQRFQAGTSFDVALPIWRVGECFLHARALCEGLGVPNAHVVVAVRYSGLAGRRLVSLEGMRAMGAFERHSAQDIIDLSATVRAGTIEDRLPEIVHEMLQPFYHIFDSLELSLDVVVEEIRRLRRRG